MVVRSLFIFLILCNITSAKSLTRRVHVTSLKRDVKTKMYGVTFMEMAAIYRSSKSTEKCLEYSAKSSKSVLIKWNMKTLTIEKCKK